MPLSGSALGRIQPADGCQLNDGSRRICVAAVCSGDGPLSDPLTDIQLGFPLAAKSILAILNDLPLAKV